MPSSSAPSISKTNFLAGCQCQKLLWMKCNERDAFPPVDPGTQAMIDLVNALEGIRIQSPA